jgi:phosphoglycerate dehydrogenase-like enzyme
MSPKTILFSAPNIDFDKIFRNDDTLQNFHIDFHEIWEQKDFQPLDLSSYDYWIPNPGQNFIINGSILSKFLNLKAISTPSTGTNHINQLDCLKNNVKVFGLLDQPLGLNEISASAEFTFLKILASIRNLRLAWDEVSQGRWRQKENLLRGREINELIFGFIGMGRIGNKLGKYLEAFSPKGAFFFDPYKQNCESEYILKCDNIENILKNCDVITFCLSLTEETRELFDAEKLNMVKENAHLINTSRGEIFNEDSLTSFLAARKDVNFSADVIVGEVTNQHQHTTIRKLHKKNLINLTPHIAGASLGSQTKAAVLAVNILKHVQS